MIPNERGRLKGRSRSSHLHQASKLEDAAGGVGSSTLECAILSKLKDRPRTANLVELVCAQPCVRYGTASLTSTVLCQVWRHEHADRLQDQSSGCSGLATLKCRIGRRKALKLQ